MANVWNMAIRTWSWRWIECYKTCYNCGQTVQCKAKSGCYTVWLLCYAVEQLSSILEIEHVQGLLTKFPKTPSSNPNFRMWSTYMNMVNIMLDFIRAERDGNWTLLLEAFATMLPWLTIYDHINCDWWRHVYIVDIEMAAPEVYAEFRHGNLVVKIIKRRLNQIPADKATERINKTCKVHNGIIGITRHYCQTRDKYVLSHLGRTLTKFLKHKRYVFNLKVEEEESIFTRSDSLPSQMKCGVNDVKKLITQFTRLYVFRVNTALREEYGEKDSISGDIPLVYLASIYSSPNDMVRDLLGAEERGKLHDIINVWNA